MCHVYVTIVFIIVDSSKNIYFATSGKVLCFIKGCFFCSNDVIQIQCFCPILELQPAWCVLLSTDFFDNTRGKAACCSGHLYSPLPYACVYAICRLKWQHIMHFWFSLGTKRNTKFHGVARVQLGRLPIVRLTGRINLYREWGNLYRGNECLNPTSNNSTVHAVSRGYTSGRAKWQFT